VFISDAGFNALLFPGEALDYFTTERLAGMVAESVPGSTLTRDWRIRAGGRAAVAFITEPKTAEVEGPKAVWFITLRGRRMYMGTCSGTLASWPETESACMAIFESFTFI
jgi:hypothetical protein